MTKLILVINPGSTSTKLAIFDDTHNIKTEVLRHDPAKIKSFKKIVDQKQYRTDLISDFLKQNNINTKNLAAVVARGGLLHPMSSGTYLVNEAMIKDLSSGFYGEHASNLGGIIAYEYSQTYNIPAFIVDPVVVDELSDIARVSGTDLFQRKVIFHALNHKAVARRYAKEQNKQYEELDLIVCHLGGGITIGWHHLGKVIDVNDGLGGDGPFSPERAGGVPAFPLIDICFDGKLSKQDIQKHLVGNGGLMAYLGTSDIRSIEEKSIQGDKKCDFYIKAMAYQVAKEIGSLYFAANYKIDQLIITGGIAYSKLFIKYLLSHFNASVKYTIYPGEDEMQALLDGALRVLNKQELVKIYK